MVLGALLACVASAPGAARACSGHGTIPMGLEDWVLGDVDSDGLLEAFVGIEDAFVVPTESTVCVCGIGLGTTSRRLPPGVTVTGAHVAVVNPAAGTVSDLPAFVFSANPSTTAGLESGSGPGGPPGTEPLFEDATWFGFSAPVEPFAMPPLEAGEIFALGFDLDLPPSALPLSIEAQFAAGEGDAAGNPLFGGGHPPQYFTATDPVAVLVAEPDAGALRVSAFGALALIVRRRAARPSRDPRRPRRAARG